MIATRPHVSVIIAACNQLNSLKLTLGSLALNPLAVGSEILVISTTDDPLTDQFLAAQDEKGTIRWLSRASGASRTEARNRAAGAAMGKYLLFLDPGMVAGPGWADALVRTLDNDPFVGATAGKVILVDGRIDHAGLALLRWREGSRCADDRVLLTGRSLQAGKQVDTATADTPLRVQALGGEGILIRADAFAQVRGFDPDIGGVFRTDKAVAEGDPAGIDLCLRIACKGWDRVYQPASLLTRLRSPEAALEQPEQPDPSLIRMGEVWAESVEADFIVGGTQGVAPQPQAVIRPYIEPQMDADQQRGGDFASIIVLTHNARSYTETCLRSVLEHTDARHELILVDNASDDGTVDTLRQVVLARPGTRLILNDSNRGFAAGNNCGLAVARGRHLVLLNSDTVVTAGWLERMIAAADSEPRAGLFGPVSNRVSGMQQLTSVDYDPSTLEGLARFAAACGREHAGRKERCLRLTGFCLLIKRELMARIGGLDERYGMGNYEDNDYCLRALLAGYEGRIVRDCFVHHFGGASFEAAGVDYATQIRRQWEIFRSKWSIPASVAFNDPFELQDLLAGGFDARRHFEALPQANAEVVTKPLAMEARS